MERASKFYRAVFGWNIEPWGPPEYGYMRVGTVNASDAGIDGGIWKGEGKKPPLASGINAFNCAIKVMDIDETRGRIKLNSTEAGLPAGTGFGQ